MKNLCVGKLRVRGVYSDIKKFLENELKHEEFVISNEDRYAELKDVKKNNR